MIYLRDGPRQQIRDGVKTLEIRAGKRLTSGQWYMAGGGLVHGSIILGAAFEIFTDEQWQALQPYHRWPENQSKKPYTSTWAMHVASTSWFAEPKPYDHWSGHVTFFLCFFCGGHEPGIMDSYLLQGNSTVGSDFFVL
jgi:hypothetical protein